MIQLVFLTHNHSQLSLTTAHSLLGSPLGAPVRSAYPILSPEIASKKCAFSKSKASVIFDPSGGS